MKTSKACESASQRGITLILVMIFIVSLSLIAAVAMRNVGTGERIVANDRDRTLAFQGAESAGREAVALIDSVKAGTATFPSIGGYYAAAMPQGGNADFWRTTSAKLPDSATCNSADIATRFYWNENNASGGQVCFITSGRSYGNLLSPRYVIERLPDIVRSASVTEQWYRVTSRASGGTNDADVILQIQYSPP